MASQHHPIETSASQRAVGHWLWAVAVCVTVFIASGQSHVASPGIINFDKVAHALVFGLIATLVGRSFSRSAWIWAAIFITSIYGAADEVRQSFTAGRSVEVADWVADTAGAALAVALYQLWPWYRRLLEMPLFRRKRQVEKSPGRVPTCSAP
jgi:VanZ family protein